MSPRDGLLAILAAMISLTAGQELKILPYGDVQTKPLEGDILFTCQADGLGDPTIDPDLKWFDIEDREITQTSGRIYVEQGSLQILKLYITSIENADAGTYTCRGEINGAPQEAFSRLELFKDITFEDAPSPQAKAIYTDALIKCIVDGQPPPVVSWRYDGRTIVTGGRYIVESTGLTVMNITQDDDDYTYLCRAEVLEDGRYAQEEITVNVHIPPSIEQPMGVQEGIAGQEVSLSCYAKGDPHPKYDFYKDNNQSPIMDQPDRVTVDRDAGHIHFRPLIEADRGSYRCVATNDVGTAEDNGELEVKVPPKIQTLNNQTAVEGQSQSLTCESRGDPYPEMTFRKMGNDYDYELGENDGGKVILTYSTNENEDDKLATLKMEVHSLSPGDTDNYTCISTNSAGDNRVNGSLIVHYSPRFGEDHPAEFYLWAGKTRNVTCMTQAEPEPVILWFKDGVELFDNGTFKIYDMKKNSNLQITCREEDQGWIYDKYTCTARNNILPDGEMEIDVLRASLPGPPLSVSVRESSPTMVVLDVEPPADDGGIPITGYRLEYENSMREVALGEPIRIENLSPQTQYLFRIRARNEVGAGAPLDFSHKTESIRAPSALELHPAPSPPEYAFEFDLSWEKPETGGLAIDEYEFKYRPVELNSDGSVLKPLEDWSRALRLDDPLHPIQSHMFKNLQPATNYEVEVRARNDVGWSDYHPQYLFITLDDPNPMSTDDKAEPAVTRGGLDTAAVVGIVIVVFLIFLIIVDVSCYFMNGCGILMCICVNLCGKPPSPSKEKAMEEGESKEALKAPVEEAIVAQEQEVVSETPPEKEQPIDDAQMPPAAQTEDEKKPPSEDGQMEELEPEDKEEKPDVIEESVKEAPTEEPEVHAAEVEVEADEKTPLNETPQC